MLLIIELAQSIMLLAVTKSFVVHWLLERQRLQIRVGVDWLLERQWLHIRVGVDWLLKR